LPRARASAYNTQEVSREKYNNFIRRFRFLCFAYRFRAESGQKTGKMG
jgi:hypothetical protein